MSYKVNKVIYLLLGVVLGFFVGGGIIWWQLNDNNFFDFLSKNKNELSIDTSQYDQSIRPRKKSGQHFRIGNVKIPDTFIDSLKMDSATLSIEQLIALYTNEINDTVGQSTGSAYDDIVISKDELIITRLIKISGEIPEVNNNYELDSILTDQRQTPRKQKGTLKVEFWRSPLNYKGYKLDENKLVLFGLYEFNNLSIIGYNNELFIKYNKEYYLIEYTDDFRSFVLMKNESLLKELNSI
ncbi:MAG TPA: hypothetical protein PKI01_09895 [Bacteroidales bacterium]|nr:hypothetical protein [Bacteroidales bacterium]